MLFTVAVRLKITFQVSNHYAVRFDVAQGDPSEQQMVTSQLKQN
jgi:hypothetical protein